jgi:hypothetical protein
MKICVHCPEGHPICVAAEKLGRVVICPRCLTSFLADLADTTSRHARKEEPKPKRPRAKDEDEEEEDEKPQKKKARKKDEEAEADEKPLKKKTPKKVKDDDEDEEDEKPRKKTGKLKKDDDDEEADDEEVKEEEEEPIEWTRKKRQLALVSTGMKAYLIGYYAMMVTFGLLALFQLPWLAFTVLAHFNAGDKIDMDMPNLIFYIMAFFGGVGGVVLYACQIIGWVTGLLAPGRAEVRGVCITALLMFLGPVLLYLIYFFFANVVIDRASVSDRMLSLFHGFAFVSLMMALYCGLIYLGKIAGYMNMTMEKHKPQALGGFVVGGTMLLTICLVTTAISPADISIWILYIAAVLALAVDYFVITAVRDLIKTLTTIRAGIDDYIKYS